jgi:aspartokinase
VLHLLYATANCETVQVLMLSQGASKVNVGLVVQQDDLSRAVRALHSYFFEADSSVAAAIKQRATAAAAAAA